VIGFPNLAGVDVLNGTFNGTTPENCQGGTDIGILGDYNYFVLFAHTI